MTVHQLNPLNLNTPAPTRQATRGGKLLAALLSWWRYRVRPPLLPAELRQDVGLLPEVDASAYEDGTPLVLRKPLLLALWRA